MKLSKRVKSYLILGAAWLIVVLVSATVLADPAKVHRYKILRVVDGDTVEFQIKALPDELGNSLFLRVEGVDTPETFRPKCEIEALLGKNASLFVASQLDAAKVKGITLTSWDKYGGRVLGDVIYDGKSLSQELIKSGHAKAYNGTGPREGWCESHVV